MEQMTMRAVHNEPVDAIQVLHFRGVNFFADFFWPSTRRSGLCIAHSGVAQTFPPKSRPECVI